MVQDMKEKFNKESEILKKIQSEMLEMKDISQTESSGKVPPTEQIKGMTVSELEDKAEK